MDTLFAKGPLLEVSIFSRSLPPTLSLFLMMYLCFTWNCIQVFKHYLFRFYASVLQCFHVVLSIPKGSLSDQVTSNLNSSNQLLISKWLPCLSELFDNRLQVLCHCYKGFSPMASLMVPHWLDVKQSSSVCRVATHDRRYLAKATLGGVIGHHIFGNWITMIDNKDHMIIRVYPVKYLLNYLLHRLIQNIVIQMVLWKILTNTNPPRSD